MYYGEIITSQLTFEHSWIDLLVQLVAHALRQTEPVSLRLWMSCGDSTSLCQSSGVTMRPDWAGLALMFSGSHFSWPIQTKFVSEPD